MDNEDNFVKESHKISQIHLLPLYYMYILNYNSYFIYTHEKISS